MSIEGKAADYNGGGAWGSNSNDLGDLDCGFVEGTPGACGPATGPTGATALMESLATKADEWASDFTKFADVITVQSNLGMSFPVAKQGAGFCKGVTILAGFLPGQAGTIAKAAAMGCNLLEHGEITYSALGSLGNLNVNLKGSISLPTVKANTGRLQNLVAGKSAPGPNTPAAAEAAIGPPGGKTIQTCVSHPAQDMIAGMNMAASTVNGVPLGGSTSVTLGAKHPVSSSTGYTGPVQGEVNVSMPGVVSAIAPISYLVGLFDPTQYTGTDAAADGAGASHPGSAPAKGSDGGNTGTNMDPLVAKNDYMDKNIHGANAIDPTKGDIKTGGFLSSLNPGSATGSKGNYGTHGAGDFGNSYADLSGQNSSMFDPSDGMGF